jgi:type IV pilus assembly protein PilV
MKMQTRFQAGFTLLEVLITTVIFSFAMLSLGLMQMNGMKHAQSAELNSTANIHIGNMLDKMRVDRSGVENGNYLTGFDNVAVEGNAPDPADMAATAIFTWKLDLQRELPDGAGDINCAGMICTVTVRWRNVHPLLADAESGLRNEDDAPETLNFSITSQI